MEHTEIEHSGILGMRWGQRRYRNYDGTLTPEGKARYGKDSGGSTRTSSRTSGEKGSSHSSGVSKRKAVSEMTDDELRIQTARIRLESDYIRASTEYRKLTAPKESAIVASGKQIIRRSFEDVGTRMMRNLLWNTMSNIPGMQSIQNDNDQDGNKSKIRIKTANHYVSDKSI